MCFRGSRPDPKWLDEEKGMSTFSGYVEVRLTYTDMYSTLCHVQANLTNVPKLKVFSRHLDSIFYRITFDIILSFGLTEFKACIAWEENVRWRPFHRR